MKNDNLTNERSLSFYEKIIVLSCAIYPIIPAYFKIAGISFPNLCYIVFILMFFINYHNKRIILKKNILNGILIFWLIMSFLLHLYHFYLIGAVWNALCVSAGLLLGNDIKRKKLFITILNSVCIFTGIVCIFGIIEALTGFNIWNIFNNSGAEISVNAPRFGITRIVSFTYQTITYSTFLVIVACIIMYLLSLNKIISKKQIRLLKTIYFLIVVNILLTLSRSSILIFLLSQILILYCMGAKKLVRTIFKAILFIAMALIILSILSPKLFKSLLNVYYMIMAVFDDDYRGLIANTFGKDNVDAVGTRLQIYQWVYEKVKHNLIFGVGYNTSFSQMYDTGNIYHTMVEKTAIEVKYLNTFYESGIIGLITEIFVLISLLIYPIKKGFKLAKWESSISFNRIIFIIFLCLFIQYFMVNQSSEQYLFYLLIALLLSYNNNIKFER